MSKDFEKMLDDKINPFVDTVIKMHTSTLPLKHRRKAIYDLFAAAVLAGIQLSEQTSEQVDSANKQLLEHHFETPKSSIITEPQQTAAGAMKKHGKEREYAASLSTQKGGQLPDGTPRFATADQFDPQSGKYKGNK